MRPRMNRPASFLRVASSSILLSLALAPGVRADPPVVHESTDAATPAVKATNSTTGSAVRGESQNGRAIEGWSGTAYGVSGDSRTSAGVRGTSVDGRGIEGWSTKSEGVWGTTSSATAAAAEFTNTGGGDHLRAGAFRVLANGDVQVRGQLLGTAGPQGPPGPQGIQGPPGPAVRTVAVCAEFSGVGNPTCPCQGATVTRQSGICTVTSDTGGCSAQTNGCCAVCKP